MYNLCIESKLCTILEEFPLNKYNIFPARLNIGLSGYKQRNGFVIDFYTSSGLNSFFELLIFDVKHPVRFHMMYLGKLSVSAHPQWNDSHTIYSKYISSMGCIYFGIHYNIHYEKYWTCNLYSNHRSSWKNRKTNENILYTN